MIRSRIACWLRRHTPRRDFGLLCLDCWLALTASMRRHPAGKAR